MDVDNRFSRSIASSASTRDSDTGPLLANRDDEELEDNIDDGRLMTVSNSMFSSDTLRPATYALLLLPKDSSLIRSFTVMRVSESACDHIQVPGRPTVAKVCPEGEKQL